MYRVGGDDMKRLINWTKMSNFSRDLKSMFSCIDTIQVVRMADGRLVRIEYQPETGYMVPILKPCQARRQPLKNVA